MKRYLSISNLLKLGWLILCAVVLFKFLLNPEAWTNYELTMLLSIEMMILSFPLGVVIWVWIWLFGLILPGVEIQAKISVPLYWLAMVMVGYFQWFKLIPSFYFMVKNRRAKIGPRRSE